MFLGVCTYGAPSVAAWAAVAVAVSAPKLRNCSSLHVVISLNTCLAVPASSGYTAIGLSIFAMLCVAVKVRPQSIYSSLHNTSVLASLDSEEVLDIYAELGNACVVLKTFVLTLL